jgi:hypothetical protein
MGAPPRTLCPGCGYPLRRWSDPDTGAWGTSCHRCGAYRGRRALRDPGAERVRNDRSGVDVAPHRIYRRDRAGRVCTAPFAGGGWGGYALAWVDARRYAPFRAPPTRADIAAVCAYIARTPTLLPEGCWGVRWEAGSLGLLFGIPPEDFFAVPVRDGGRHDREQAGGAPHGACWMGRAATGVPFRVTRDPGVSDGRGGPDERD